MKKLTVAVFVLCLSLALLAGCAVETADPTSASEPQASDTSSQTGGESNKTGGSGVPIGAMTGSVDLMADILPQSVEKKQVDSAFVSAQMEFAVSLFKESLKSKESEENANDRGVLVSPLSAQLALAMIANGAKGDTLLEMEQVLGGGMSIAELNQYLSAYANGLPSTEGAKLNLNNAIWFKNGFCVNADFLQTNADYYGAPAYMAPFDDTTVDDINNWVEQNTDGMIEKLFDSLSNDAVMVLVNTLLFDAEWENAYGETDINDGIFTAYDGTERSVTMLSSTERYLCSSTAEGFIRYYKDKEYAFVAFLPTDGTDIFAFANSLTAEQVSSLLQSQAGTADVRLPKFTFACDLQLENILSSMGMPSAFIGGIADFTGIGKDGLYLSSAVQKTVIELTETGTKAAAATGLVVDESCVSPFVSLDEPFVYMIVDTETNLPLFMGLLTDITE